MHLPHAKDPARPRRSNLALLLLTIAVASCGGGGDTIQSPDGGAPPPPAAGPGPTPPAPGPAPDPPPAPPPPSAAGPTVTPRGTAEGFVAAETVGPAGGTVSSAGGRLEILIPPGALAAPTEITIQPITNTMPNGIGQAYRLGPEGIAFAVPVKIRFNAIPDDLDGTDLSVVDLVSQTAEGTWQAYPAQVADAGTGSVTVDSLHFSDWGSQAGYLLTPPSAALSVREQLSLTLSECGYVDAPKAGGGTYKALDCKGSTTALLDRWQLNGNDIDVSPTSLGTLVPTNTGRAGYKAPDLVPGGNPVVASARLQVEGRNGTPRLSAKITIIDRPGYTLYAERKQILENPLQGRQEISSVSSGRWVYSASQSFTNNAPTWLARGHVSIKYKVTNPVCTTSLRGGAAFDEAPGINGLFQVPGTTKFSFGAAVSQVTLTGTSECEGKPPKPLSLTIDWAAIVGEGTVAPDANGTLAGSVRLRPQGGEVVEQTFKFEPDGR